MSERRPEQSVEQAAIELEGQLNQALDDFASVHASLVRRACQVPDGTPLDDAVVCTFLGHTLGLVRKLQGRASAERLALTVLERLETAASMQRQSVERLQ